MFVEETYSQPLCKVRIHVKKLELTN
jgi:hypothetical protein